jgi:hypothetical protein
VTAESGWIAQGGRTGENEEQIALKRLGSAAIFICGDFGYDLLL